MFVNGEEIEYLTGNGWTKGTYVGKYPTNEGNHVICTIHGVLRYGQDIRKPKQKKEGWISVYTNGVCGSIYATEEAARAASGVKCIAVSRIEWEE